MRFLAKRAGLEVPEDPEYQSRYRKQERLWAPVSGGGPVFPRDPIQPRRGGRTPVRRAPGPLQGAPSPGLEWALPPNRWDGLLTAMKGKGYSEEELLESGLALRSEKSGNLYDRFRNRLMFPIIDVRGHVIGFGGRVMDDSTPKYLNSPETLDF